MDSNVEGYVHSPPCLQLKNLYHLPELHTDKEKSFFLAPKKWKHPSNLLVKESQ